MSWVTRLTAAIIAIATMASAAAQTPEWNKIVEAAKAEGKVTLYSGHVGVPYHPEVAKMFEAKYGIHVEILDLRASDLAERIRTEQATKRIAADVILNGAGTLWLMKNQGVLAAYGDLPDLGRLRADVEKDDARLPIYIQGYGIAVNTARQGWRAPEELEGSSRSEVEGQDPRRRRALARRRIEDVCDHLRKFRT